MDVTQSYQTLKIPQKLRPDERQNSEEKTEHAHHFEVNVALSSTYNSNSNDTLCKTFGLMNKESTGMDNTGHSGAYRAENPSL